MHYSKILLIFVVVSVLASGAFCQKSGKNGKNQAEKPEKSKKQAPSAAQSAPKAGVNQEPVVNKKVVVEAPPPEPQAAEQQQQQSTEQPQVTPEVRQCRCDELDQCIRDTETHYNDLSSRCRHQCGVAFLSNETAEHVANCYDAFEKSKKDQKSNKHRCVEKLINKPCLTDNNQAPPTQATLTVDPSKIAQPRTKRNYKTLLAPNLNMYASCVKICRKNSGIVHFNADGTPSKNGAGKANGNANAPAADAAGAKVVVEKAGKGYAGCAAKLGCQLLPVDKRLEKQAKQICKYQPVHHEDIELNLCTCLEGALKQNFQCDTAPVTSSSPNTCSASSSSQSGEKSCQH